MNFEVFVVAADTIDSNLMPICKDHSSDLSRLSGTKPLVLDETSGSLSVDLKHIHCPSIFTHFLLHFDLRHTDHILNRHHRFLDPLDITQSPVLPSLFPILAVALSSHCWSLKVSCPCYIWQVSCP